ncbi:nucleotidyltransferase [Longibacter salinarum]|uniref:Nucleotidyltransferase n=1 Tax=Longibacter salinarum TaxID=1850348 RepID=A0A2A8D305_9BACT|nr:nucleotidyltransferase [Longibacter salinarum]
MRIRDVPESDATRRLSTFTRLPANSERTESALESARSTLEDIYGDRLIRLILFGSHARGDAHADSDVDLLVVLEGSVDPYEEARRTSGVVVDAAVEQGVALSLTHLSASDWMDTTRSFVRNARRDGVEL